MKLALVHDWLNQMGGAEDVLEVLVDLYPESPVYTSIYDPLKMPD
ncbi:MAG: glycosyltransferase family 4 protein, partial [Chloroflexota bacterium]